MLATYIYPELGTYQYAGGSLKYEANFLYYWTYSNFPWSAFLKISFNTLMNILKDQTLPLMIESPCLKYEIASREGLSL